VSPQVCWGPGMRFGEPHIKGISVDAIGGMVWAGELWHGRYDVEEPPDREET